MCYAKLLSCVPLCVTLWTAACQVPLSMGFSRQEYWSGLPCPLSGDLPDPGPETVSLTFNLHWQVGSLPLAPPGKPPTTGLPGNSKSGSILEYHLAFNLKKKKNPNNKNKPPSENVLSVYSQYTASNYSWPFPKNQTYPQWPRIHHHRDY